MSAKEIDSELIKEESDIQRSYEDERLVAVENQIKILKEKEQKLELKIDQRIDAKIEIGSKMIVNTSIILSLGIVAIVSLITLAANGYAFTTWWQVLVIISVIFLLTLLTFICMSSFLKWLVDEQKQK